MIIPRLLYLATSVAATKCIDEYGPVVYVPGFVECPDDTGVNTSAIPDSFNYTQYFLFESPNVIYDGEWKTDGNVAISDAGGNVTVRAAGSGIEFLGRNLKRVFVNGTEHNAAINGTQAHVDALPYDWYEFTVEAGANATFRSATAIADGARWAVPVEKWTNQKGLDGWKTPSGWDLSTTSSGTKITLDIPKGSALVNIYTAYPPVPFGAYDVTVTPAPPFGPAMQEFASTLQRGERAAAKMLAVLPTSMFSTLLDPSQKYSVTVMHAGYPNGALPGREVKITGVGYFLAKSSAGRVSWSVLAASLGAVISVLLVPNLN